MSTPDEIQLFAACRDGDIELVRALLARNPSLVRARDEPDNATPLHLAAARGHLDLVRLLLDAGADVQGAGDVHNGDVIGWAMSDGNEAVVNLLLERGARHHIFSAIATGNVDLVADVVARDPGSLARRRSHFEQGQTPLHFAIAQPDGLGKKPPDYRMLEQLLRLGADVSATDDKGRTALEVAMLQGEIEAARLLAAAGAKEPEISSGSSSRAPLAEGAKSIKTGVPSINVADIQVTLDWYTSIGFAEIGRYEEDGVVTFGMVMLGAAQVAFGIGPGGGPHGVSLWFYTDNVHELYQGLKQRQLRIMQSVLRGEPTADRPIAFQEDLYEPFYGGSQFSIEDNNGVSLVFYQE